MVGIAERLYNIHICRHTQNAARRGKRGQARQGADLGADPGADFIFEMRGIVGRLTASSLPHIGAMNMRLVW